MGIKSPLEIVKRKLHVGRQTIAVVSLDAVTSDMLARMRRGKRAFGQRVDDKLVLSSLRGLQTAKSTMKYLGGDTFFNKWSVPLVPLSSLPTMTSDDYGKMWELDTTSDRLVEDSLH